MVDTESSAGWENTTYMWDNVSVAASIDASSSEVFHQYSMPAIITLSTFIVIVMILSIGGNSMVILTIVRHKGMRTRTNMFITNLAISDILAAIFDMPVSLITLIKGRWIFGDTFCLFNGFTVALFLLTSIHTLMYISIHKYMSITRPFSRFMTPKRILIMIIGTWVWSSGYAAAAALGWNQSVYKYGTTQCGPSYPDNLTKMTHSMVNTIFNFIIPLLVMTFCYARIFHEIRHHMQRMRDTSNMDMRNSLLQQKRIAVTLFMVLACFLLCIAPYIGYSTSIAIKKGKVQIPLILNPVAYWFVYTNSACNPIIYAFRSPSFRQGYREIMCGRSAAYLSGGSFRSVSQPWSRSFRSSSKSTVTTHESIPNEGGRLSMANSRLSGLRRSSDSSWRKVSLMASWRGYKNQRRTQSVDSAQSCTSALSATAENGGQRDSYHHRQSNGVVARFQHFNTIAEASVEDDPSSATSVDKVVPPKIQIQSEITEKQKDHTINASSGDCTCLNHLHGSVTSEDKVDLSTTNDDGVVVQEHIFVNDENDDAFYDSDVDQEDKSVTPKGQRRLQSRSCVYHGKASPQTTPKLAQKQENEEIEPVKRSRSWSDTGTTSSPEQSESNNKIVPKRPLPSPFLWQPSVDYLDVPRHLLRKHKGHSDGNIAESSEKEETPPMTKLLTSSFKMLFRKSQEKNVDCDKRSKASSESVA